MATTWKSSLRDSIYKPIYNKTTAPAKKKSEPEGKKEKEKKMKTKTKKRSQKKSDPPRPRRTPGHMSLAAWVARLGPLEPQAVRAWPREPQVVRAWRPGSRDPSRTTWAVQAPSCVSSFSLSDLIWLFFSLIWFDLVRWCCAWDLNFFWFINRVLETRFSSGHHVEKDATSNVIRPWKSSLKESIYRPKLSLLDSSC